MKTTTAVSVLLVLTLFSFSIQAWPGTYRTHPQMIDIYKQLCDSSPHANYVSVGKTLQGNDIWMFRVGNPNGGRILIDGCMHGWEDMGSEVTYLFLEWLLESNDQKANELLVGTYWLIIPVLNYDSYGRGNANYSDCPTYGVDLNRNFVRGWVSRQDCGNTNNGIYGCTSGDYPASEPETRVLKQVFSDYKPDVYINTHYGGGPFIGYRGANAASFWTPIRNRVVELWSQNGVKIQNVGFNTFLPTGGSPSGSGLAVGDAYDADIEPFLIETLNRNTYANGAPINNPGGGNPSYNLVENDLYPIYKHYYVAVGEHVWVEPADQVRCYRCENKTLVSRIFVGTNTCPEGWYISPPSDCFPTPGFEILIFLLALIGGVYKRRKT